MRYKIKDWFIVNCAGKQFIQFIDGYLPNKTPIYIGFCEIPTHLLYLIRGKIDYVNEYKHQYKNNELLKYLYTNVSTARFGTAGKTKTNTNNFYFYKMVIYQHYKEILYKQGTKI